MNMPNELEQVLNSARWKVIDPGALGTGGHQ
jgi:hypothetical protein